MMTGYLPSSGGLDQLNKTVDRLPSRQPCATFQAPALLRTEMSHLPVIKFYKTWDEWGAFSNFALYPIRMFDGPGPHKRLPSPSDANTRLWPSVEHYYQCQKFAGTINSINELNESFNRRSPRSGSCGSAKANRRE